MKPIAKVIPVATMLAALLVTPLPAYSSTLQVGVGLNPDPQVLRGTSGGSKSSDCGFIATAPNEVIKVTQPIPYMRFSVQSAGQPTLLIEGPTGRFCVLADGGGAGPQMSGFWAPGTYSVYIGDRAKGSNPYTLSLTQSSK
ncbi:hypothetical protein BST81_21985 [Leptolyngbya sp. 'hensonii']|uniref:hypothetical protein n=1 Tax=Leptolyngbya sp. 'hensonii' TaxID=1922337 RepID=UPI0009500B5B|nr:hypothetical protein [Leptolyngbya sp. 'hensonii']OLP16274.1 hypothetical protein BST81_21985 [Leptolyngbya sp. 'hensonii']